MPGSTGRIVALALAAAVGAAAPAWAGSTERVSIGPGGAQAKGATAAVDLDLGRRAPRRLPRRPATWCPGDTNGSRRLRARPVGRHGRRGSAAGSAAPRPTGAADPRRSRPAGATSRSSRPPATWCRATPTEMSGRLRARPPRGPDDAGERRARRRPGRRTACPVDLGRRALVAFSSFASNLVPATPTAVDVFVRDQGAGTTGG
jgi:hypothetical protein